MSDTSRLVKMKIVNLGCIGPEGCEIALDSVLCLVGANNAGKSTILRAYELALGTKDFDKEHDPCARADGSPTTVEIWVHIPEGTANVGEKWKEIDGNLRLVRSKWEWNEDNNWGKTRTTWNPETGDYSEDDKASGLDNVFNSRLPKPFRIGSLEDPVAEHKKLLTLVLQPIADKLDREIANEGSELRKTISEIEKLARAPVDEERDRLENLKSDLNRSHNAIFPDLTMDFDIGIGKFEINPLKNLLENSKLKFKDWEDEVSWAQQGTGSQRALFWTMLQVRSRLSTFDELAKQNKKSIADLEKRKKKLQGEAEKVKKAETKQSKLKEMEEIDTQIATLTTTTTEELLSQQSQELSLPGYMLLIDEPEVGLHPNAIRAASRYLYTLTDDRAWQVMLATHSPVFIDPLHDHTTIVRLERSQANPTPRTYRSSSMAFSSEEKENLKILNRFDQGLAEMFFGQFPVLIEGDTEYAAFELLMNKYPKKFPASRRPVLVRARGKHTMLLVMRILNEFCVSFAVLHDADTPFRKDGKHNGSWEANKKIYAEIVTTRKQGVRVVHRVSVPGFEYAHLPIDRTDNGELIETSSKDKPWNTVRAMQENEAVESSILSILTELTKLDSAESSYSESFEDDLLADVQKWATEHCPQDSRFGLE